MIIECIFKQKQGTRGFNENYILPLMDKLSREKKDILIMGGFNINLLNYNNDKDTTTFLDIMSSNSFSPFITLPTRVGNTSETLIDNIFYNKPLNNDMTAGNLCFVISDHLIQFLVETSSFMHSSSKEKITKRCYMKFDKEKIKSDLGKVNWQEHCNNPDPNVSMEHFLKIVHLLLDRHTPFESFNKKPNINSSKPWITTGIAKSIKVKDNLYKKFSSETNLQKKAEYQKQFRTYRNYISIPLRCSKDSYYNGRFEENKRNVKTVWKTVKELITIKQRNELPLTTLQIGKKIETNDKLNAKEIANHSNDYFTIIAGELYTNILKSKNMHLSYLGSIKKNNMFLTPTTPNDIEILIDNMKIHKGVGPNSIPTKILRDYKSEFFKPLSDMI